MLYLWVRPCDLKQLREERLYKMYSTVILINDRYQQATFDISIFSPIDPRHSGQLLKFLLSHNSQETWLQGKHHRLNAEICPENLEIMLEYWYIKVWEILGVRPRSLVAVGERPPLLDKTRQDKTTLSDLVETRWSTSTIMIDHHCSHAPVAEKLWM